MNILVYDINPSLCKPKGTKLDDLISCEIIFISVPTPMKNDGSCYLEIIKNLKQELNNLNYLNSIILRSTVPVGTCDDLGFYFMPEFLTEKNYIEDFKNNKEWILGLKNDDRDFYFKKNYGKIN